MLRALIGWKFSRIDAAGGRKSFHFASEKSSALKARLRFGSRMRIEKPNKSEVSIGKQKQLRGRRAARLVSRQSIRGRKSDKVFARLSLRFNGMKAH